MRKHDEPSSTNSSSESSTHPPLKKQKKSAPPPLRFFNSAREINSIESNPFHRFDKHAPKGQKQAYILIDDNEDKKHWGQFDSLEQLDCDRFRPITSVTRDTSSNRLYAQSPGGTIFQGDPLRGIHMQFNGGYRAIAQPLSPVRPHTFNHTISLFPCDDSRFAVKKGRRMIVSSSPEKKTKGKSTRQVMKKTAKQAFQEFYTEHKENLKPDAQEFLEELSKDYEWLHAIAKSFTANRSLTQHKSNLAAGPADENTRMMILEKFARVFAKYPGMSVEAHPEFTLLPDSELIQCIDYTLFIRYQKDSAQAPVTLTIHTHCDVFTTKECPRSSDQLMVSVAFDLLQKRPFARCGEIKKHRLEMRSPTMKISKKSSPRSDSSQPMDFRL